MLTDLGSPLCCRSVLLLCHSVSREVFKAVVLVLGSSIDLMHEGGLVCLSAGVPGL